MSYLFVFSSKIAHPCLQANSTAVVDTLDPDQPDLEPQDGEEGQESLDKVEPVVEVLGNKRIKRSAAAPDILGALGADKSGRQNLAKYVLYFAYVLVVKTMLMSITMGFCFCLNVSYLGIYQGISIEMILLNQSIVRHVTSAQHPPMAGNSSSLYDEASSVCSSLSLYDLFIFQPAWRSRADRGGSVL